MHTRRERRKSHVALHNKAQKRKTGQKRISTTRGKLNLPTTSLPNTTPIASQTYRSFTTKHNGTYKLPNTSTYSLQSTHKLKKQMQQEQSQNDTKLDLQNNTNILQAQSRILYDGDNINTELHTNQFDILSNLNNLTTTTTNFGNNNLGISSPSQQLSSQFSTHNITQSHNIISHDAHRHMQHMQELQFEALLATAVAQNLPSTNLDQKNNNTQTTEKSEKDFSTSEKKATHPSFQRLAQRLGQIPRVVLSPLFLAARAFGSSSSSNSSSSSSFGNSKRHATINIQLKSLGLVDNLQRASEEALGKSRSSKIKRGSSSSSSSSRGNNDGDDDIPSTGKSKKSSSDSRRSSSRSRDDGRSSSKRGDKDSSSRRSSSSSSGENKKSRDSFSSKRFGDDNNKEDEWTSESFYQQPMGKKNPLYANREQLNHIGRNAGIANHLLLGSNVNKTQIVKDGKTKSKDRLLGGKKSSSSSSDDQDNNSTYKPSASQQQYNAQREQRKLTDDLVQQRLRSFKEELINIEDQLTAPLQDLITQNYDYIQHLAVKSADGTGAGNKKNQSRSSDKDVVQLVENIAGGFHALESGGINSDDERHNTALALDHIVDADSYGKKSKIINEEKKQQLLLRQQKVKKLLQNGQTNGITQDDLNKLIGADKWGLPNVDGVSKTLSTVYSAEPKIDSTILPTFLKQIVYTAEKRLILAAKKEQELLLSNNDNNKTKLLGGWQGSGGSDSNNEQDNNKKALLLTGGVDNNNNDDDLNNLLSLQDDDIDEFDPTSIVDLSNDLDFAIHPESGEQILINLKTQQPIDQTTALILKQNINLINISPNDKKSNEIKEYVSLKDNLPITNAFLPPMTSIAPPTEMTQNGGLSKDAIMAVSLSDNILLKQFERQHIEKYKKEYTTLIKKNGQKEGQLIFWRKYPLPKKKLLLPKEQDISAKYMSLLTEQRELIKDVISATGYGHLQQKSSRSELLNNLLQTTTDDHELLLLLKQAQILNNDVQSLNEITIDSRYLKSKEEILEIKNKKQKEKENNNNGIVEIDDDNNNDNQENNNNILIGKDALKRIAEQRDDIITYKQQKFDEFNWLNSQETIILPYTSPDGFSDVHLPQTLRTALRIMEDTFNSLKNTITPSATAYTNMLSLYGQLGLPARAALLFDEILHDSDVVADTTTYNVMLNILQQDNKIDLCVQLFENMRTQAVELAGFGKFAGLPPKHVEARKIKKLRTMISKKAKAMGIDNVDMTGLIDIIKENPQLRGTYLNADGNDEDKYKPSKDLIARPDVVTYTTVIKALGKAKYKKDALKLFEQMKKDQIKPNELTWTTCIDIACDNNDFLTGLRLFHEMKQSGLRPTRATYSAMTTAAARNGEIALTTALLHEMMITQQQQIDLFYQQGGNKNNNIALHNKMLIDGPFIGSIMRSSAQGGNAAFSLKLHNQLQTGQIIGSGNIINGRKNNNPNPNQQQNNNIQDKLPNAITYNALLEVLADPASWGRTSLPPAALRIGLAVYQEALINKVFQHPYSEVQSTGVLDLRPYTRGAVLFPIHFYLNSLLGEVPVYNVDGINNINNQQNNNTKQIESSSSSNNNKKPILEAISSTANPLDPTTPPATAATTSTTSAHFNPTKMVNTANLDLAVQSITSRKAPSAVVGQSPYSIIQPSDNNNNNNTSEEENNNNKKDNNEIITTNNNNEQKSLTTEQSSSSSLIQPIIKFPHLNIPPKGVVFVANKEVKPMWTAAPDVARRDFMLNNKPKYIQSIEYVENVLKHTRPWIHFTRLQQQPNDEKSKRDGGAYKSTTSNGKTVNNPNSLLVSANGLRHWVANQTDSVRTQEIKM